MQSVALALGTGPTVAYHPVTKPVPARASPVAILLTAIILIDVAFILLYRSGFPVSFGVG